MGFFDKFFANIAGKRKENMTRVYRGVEFTVPKLPNEKENDGQASSNGFVNLKTTAGQRLWYKRKLEELVESGEAKIDPVSGGYEILPQEPKGKEYKIDEDLKCDYLFLVDKISELEKRHWYARWNFVSEVERGKMCSSEEKIKLIDNQVRTAEGLLRDQVQKIAQHSCPDEFISVGLCNDIEEAIKNGKDTFTVKGY